MSLLDYIESSNAKHILNQIFAGSFSEELNYISIKNNDNIDINYINNDINNNNNDNM